jgi:hypothetical protein
MSEVIDHVGIRVSGAFVLDLDGNNVEAVFHEPLP